MDARCKKGRDFVAITKNFTEGIRKGRLMQMKWFQKYEWLLDEHVKVQQEIEELCKEKYRVSDTAESDVELRGRSCLPAPITTSADYGWLAAKPEFRLEKYGPYNPVYPDPLHDITHLPGNMPVLAAGKGFVWGKISSV